MTPQEQAYHSALSQCAELLDNMKDGDPLTDLPIYLAAKLAQSQPAGAARQGGNTSDLTDDQIIEICEANYGWLAGAKESEIIGFARAAIAAHLAGQSQATKVQAVPEGWKSLNDVQWMNIVNHDHAYHSFTKDEAVHEAVKRTEAKLKELNADPTTQEVTQQAAPVCQPRTVSDERKSFDTYWGALEDADATEAELEMCEYAAWQAWQARPRYCAALPLKSSAPETAATQQAAKAETAEQAEGEQANVLPPTRGTDSQHDAVVAALTDEEIQIIWQTMPGGPAGWLKSFGYLQFAREVEAELACRFRAQGGNTNTKSGSDLAPTTSTVSASRASKWQPPVMPEPSEALAKMSRRLAERDALVQLLTQMPDPDAHDAQNWMRTARRMAQEMEAS